jgi:hypothetical protein
MIFGSGEHSYRAVEGWGLGPDGWSFGIVSSMATEGAFQEEWTHLTPANDLFIDADDVVYLAEAPFTANRLTKYERV